jgi:hypothetical protein
MKHINRFAEFDGIDGAERAATKAFDYLKNTG